MSLSDRKLLSGRVAIIAGGGGEIGGAIALRYASEGAAVVVCDISLEKAEAVAEAIRKAGGQAKAIKVDVSNEADCDSAARMAVETFGKITTLVNASATASPDGNVETLSSAAWREAIDVNFTGVFLMCKYTMGHIRAAGGGAVVNIASSHGHFGLPGRSAYCSTKAALMHFTRVLAIDYGPHNIRANTISPGPIDTARSLRRFGTRENSNKVRGRGQVLGRTGTVEEVASVAVFLASDEASFVTGTDLLVDGGQTAFKGTALSDIHQSAT
jgi:NAD(P)-dependent dehydrogenase (short-subunit alcohol dehydrogenase family)